MLQDELERIEAEIADIYSLLFRGMTHEELFAKIIEEVLEEAEAANALYDAFKQHGARMEWTVLSPASKDSDCCVNKKWKVKVNYDVEVDDL